jgi:hypothetical protein
VSPECDAACPISMSSRMLETMLYQLICFGVVQGLVAVSQNRESADLVNRATWPHCHSLSPFAYHYSTLRDEISISTSQLGAASHIRHLCPGTKPSRATLFEVGWGDSSLSMSSAHLFRSTAYDDQRRTAILHTTHTIIERHILI